MIVFMFFTLSYSYIERRIIHRCSQKYILLLFVNSTFSDRLVNTCSVKHKKKSAFTQLN